MNLNLISDSITNDFVESIENISLLQLGKAISVLITNIDEKTSFESIKPNPSDLNFQAIYSFNKHLKKNSENVIDVTLYSLVEKVTQVKNLREKENSLKLSLYTFQNVPFSIDIFAKKSQTMFQKNDNKVRLGISYILNYIFCHFSKHWANYSTNLAKKVEDKREKKVLIEEIEDEFEKSTDLPKVNLENALNQLFAFQQFSWIYDIKFFLAIIEQETIKEQQIWKPTKLTISMSDLFWNFTNLLSVLPNLKNKIPSLSNQICDKSQSLIILWNHLSSFIKLIEISLTWFRDIRPIYCKALNHLKSMFLLFEKLDKKSKEIGEKFDFSESQEFLRFFLEFHCIYLIEIDSSFTTEKSTQEILWMFSQLKDPMQMELQLNDEEREKNEEIFSMYLTCCCLLIGRMKKKEFQIFLIQFGATVFPSLMQQLSCKKESLVQLSLEILQNIFFYLIQGKENQEEISSNSNLGHFIPSMLEFISQRDSSSLAVVSFIGKIAASHPQFLDQIFENLESKEKIARENSLKILSEVFRINYEVGTQDKKMSEKLANFLLLKLYDQELSLRVESSKLFSNLDPEFIIPKLSQLLYHKDYRYRSAAEVAFVETLTNNRKPLEVFFLLLNYLQQDWIVKQNREEKNLIVSPSDLIENKNYSKIQTPGDIGNSYSLINSEQKIEEKRKDFTERIVRILPKWAEKLSSHLWPSFVNQFLDFVFLHLEDSISIKFSSILSPQLSKYPEILLPKIIEKLKDLKNSKTIFEKIRPLLILKTLSPFCFQFDHYEDLNEQEKKKKIILLLQEELNLRISNFEELDEVRKLSGEIEGKLPFEVVWPISISQINQIMGGKLKLKEMIDLKAKLFVLANSLTVFGEKIGEKNTFQLVPILWKILRISNENKNKNEEEEEEHHLHRLQLGCIDLFALIFCSFFRLKEESSSHLLLDSLLQELRSLNDSNNNLIVFLSLKIRIVNVFIAYVKISTTSIISLHSFLCLFTSKSFPVITKLFKNLQKSFFPSSLDENILLFTLMAALVQLYFFLAFQLKDNCKDYLNDFAYIVILSLKEKSKEADLVRTNALKLLGVLLTFPEELLSDANLFFQLQNELENISTIDTASEARQLAEKYLSLMNKK